MRNWLLLCVWVLCPLAPARGDSKPVRADVFGDPLPENALARMGTIRWRTGYGSPGALPPDVSSVITKDGRTIYVAGSDDNTISAFDLQTGLRLRTFKEDEPGISALALSPDGELLVCGGTNGMSVWELKTGKKMRRMRAGRVRTVVFSPDGKKLVTGGQERDNSVRVFDVATAKEQLRMLGHKGEVNFVACAPDGRTIVTASGDDAKVRIADISTGETMRTIAAKNTSDTLVALSPDGKNLAFSELRSRNRPANWIYTIRLVEVETGKQLWIQEQGQQRIIGLTFTPDGRRLICSDGKSFQLLDTATGQRKNRYPGGGARLQCTADGKRLIAASSIIRVWNLDNGEELHAFAGHMVPPTSLSYSPDGGMLAACAFADPAILAWDVGSGKLVRRVGVSVSYLRDVQFTPAGRLISGDGDGMLRMWDMSKGNEIQSFQASNPIGKDPRLQVLSMSVSRDGKRLSASCLGFNAPHGMPETIVIFVWNLENGKLLHQREVKEDGFSFTGPAFLPDGRFYLTPVGSDLAIRETLSGGILKKLESSGRGNDQNDGSTERYVGSAVISANGASAAIVCSRLKKDGNNYRPADYVIQLFDLETGRRTHRIPFDGLTQGMAFSSDGKRIACAGRHAVHIWDVGTGKNLWQSPQLDDCPYSVAFSPDGDRLASGMSDTTILVWDVRSLKQKSPGDAK
jgi:WD40 repeat protein